MALGIDDKEKKPDGLQPSGPNQMQAGPAPLSQPPQQKKATGFVNLNKYMQANTGNQLGQAVGGGISNQAGAARSNLNQAQNTFQTNAQQGRVGTEKDVNQMNTVLQDPTKATEQDVNAFQKFRTQGYIGPQGLQNQEQLQSQAQQAGQMGQAIGSTGGRLGLLQRFAGGNQQYGGGSQRMDEMLLGRGAGQQLRDARRASTGVSSELQAGLQGAQELAHQYGNEAEAFKGQVGKELGSRESAVTDVLGKRIGEETAKKEQLGKDLTAGLQSGELTKEQADMLGLQEGQEMYGTDLSHYLKAGESPATMQNVASSQEMANMNALAKLGGKQAFGKDEEAGSFLKNQYGLDKDTMMKKIAENKANYESQMGGVSTGKQAAIDRAMNAVRTGLSSTIGGNPNDVHFSDEAAFRANVENLMKTGQLGSLGAGSKWGYNMFNDQIGGGYQAQNAFQDQLRQEAELQKQYSPDKKIRFKQVLNAMNPNKGLEGPS